MNRFTAYSPHNAPRLTLTALAMLCLVGATLQSAALTAAGPARISPAKIAAAPAVAAQTLADQDIRDIRPPYHIPPGWLWLAWIAGGLALLVLGYGAWRWRRRRGLRVKLPYEIALEQLEAARRWMQPDQAREFSIAVSEVVRDYIEKCFPVRAAHRTTNEFLRDLATRSDSPLVAYQPVLTDFLRHCDLAKFARWILSVPQMEAMLHSAGTFVLATGKPVSVGSKGRAVGTTSARSLPTLPASPASAASVPAYLRAAASSTTLNSVSS